MWAKMAGGAWERPGPQASRQCPAGWGQGGARHVLPPTRRLGQGGWCGRACRGPSVAWSSSWSNKSAERRPKPRASHAWAQCPPFNLSLLIYEMGVLAGRIRCSLMCSSQGTPRVLPACPAGEERPSVALQLLGGTKWENEKH